MNGALATSHSKKKCERNRKRKRELFAVCGHISFFNFTWLGFFFYQILLCSLDSCVVRNRAYLNSSFFKEFIMHGTISARILIIQQWDTCFNIVFSFWRKVTTEEVQSISSHFTWHKYTKIRYLCRNKFREKIVTEKTT